MDATDVARQRPVGLADLARIPLRRWRTVLVSTGVLLLLVVAYLVFVPPVYTATTVVVVRPVVTDPFSLPAGGADRAVNMTAESGIATSNDVIDRVAVITGRDPEDVEDALEVETPVGGQLMRFNYKGVTDEGAVAGANGAAETYLDLRKGMYEDQRAAVLKSYDDTIALVTTQRTTTQKALPNQSTGGSSPRTSALLDQIRALNDQLAQLAEQRSKIASADLSPGSITSAARAPVPSNRDTALLLVVAALLGGLLLGALVAFVREAMDRRIRSGHEVGELVGAPLLGTVHRSGKGDSALSDLRYLALALSQWVERPRSVPLVLLSSDENEGRAQVSAGLAAVLAEAGHEVRLGSSPESLEQIRPVLLAAQRRVPPTAVPAVRPRVDTPTPVAKPPAEPTSGARPVGGVVVPARSIEDTVQITPVRRPGPAGGGSPDDTIQITPVRRPGPVGGGSPDDTVQITPVRKPRPSPGPDAKNGAVYRSGTAVDQPKPASAPTSAGKASVPAAPAGAPATPAAPLDPVVEADDRTIRIGSGVVRLIRELDSGDDRGLVLLDAPAATRDDRGVRIARDGYAVLVAARDHTRTARLSRLVERLRVAGVNPVGFVLTGDGRD
ncbi:hypothetical protein O7606_13355 [Micromonospora sp. WMMD882]|uniref:Wzz/FepE/Etk N-terminal domain-containing protein n=1 Tax=Micromonospora sp. WMMD882 TaxID=3015151 RepID=UPI00248ADE6C|nr:Wzz/FepE/Etk N-terminal domain-containing protein [Micromonospora sp. WMMD882]WBB77287.1 hypothetical protein O7606_13355 [Micromonospora sp. WMMD882]